MNEHLLPYSDSDRPRTDQPNAHAEAAWHSALYHQLPLVFFAIDDTARIRSVSGFGAERLGYSQPDLTGRSILEFVHPDDRVLFLEQLAAAESERSSDSWSSRLRYKHSQWQWIKFTAKRMVYEHQPLVVLGCEDVGVQAVAIAQQADLFLQVQRLRRSLEILTQERTAQLQRALESEALAKQIVDRVRDELDETQILQTAVRELALNLKTYSSNTGIYDLEQDTSTIVCEYICSTTPTVLGQTFCLSDYPEIYRQLLQGQPLQFCWIDRSTTLHPLALQCTRLACPVIDAHGVIGDLWVYRLHGTCFEDAEIYLVQQVASQCAIAIRQARLYKATQTQVHELERLHQVKDDFLNTVSHELRSPIANIDMAAQMLEILLHQAGVLERHDRMMHYFNVLREECQRETELINNLLDLSRLEAGAEPLILTTIDLNVWIPHLIEPFLERIQQQQQQLQIALPDDLPLLTTDLSSLERIVTELLHNACKYTPGGEEITIAAQIIHSQQERCERHSLSVAQSCSLREVRRIPAATMAPTLVLRVSNSGVEISADELPRIFDKFYRVRRNDLWNQGGTGLGLALVRRLVEHLGGMVWVISRANQVTFAIELPLQPLE